MSSINSLLSGSANDIESNYNNCREKRKESKLVPIPRPRPIIICFEDDDIDLEKTLITESIPIPRPRPIITCFEDDDIGLETIYMDIVYDKKHELDLHVEGIVKVSLVPKSHRLSVIYENLSKYNSK